MQTQASEQLYDIYGVWHIPFWQTTWFFVSVMSLLGVILAYIGYRLFFFVYRKKEVSYWEYAQQQLEMLEQELHNNRIDAKKFYFRLTDIMKKYLHDRYSYDVLGSTDAEVISYIKKQNLSSSLIEDMSTVFEGLQEIKFARGDAATDRMMRDITLSKACIAQTVPTSSK